MMKTLIRRLFLSKKTRSEKVKDLSSNPNFRMKEAMQKHGTDSFRVSDFKLEKGKVESVFTPDIGSQKGLTLTKWYFKPGDIVERGDIVCDIENENISMELESVFSGRILSICKLNEKLVSGTELFKIEGL